MRLTLVAATAAITGAGAWRGRWTAAAKFASYAADEFAADTRKLWLQLEWAY